MSEIRIVASDSPEQQPEKPGRIDLEANRVGQDFGSYGGRKAVVDVPIRKPGAQSFFRTRSGAQWRWDTVLFKVGGEDGAGSRELYLVDQALRDEPCLVGQAAPYMLYYVVNQFGDPCLWPVRLPGRDGKDNDYWSTAHKAARMAETHWARIEPKPGGLGYSIWIAENETGLGEPVWPELTFQEIVDMAFEGRVIDSRQHPIIKRLLGR